MYFPTFNTYVDESNIVLKERNNIIDDNTNNHKCIINDISNDVKVCIICLDSGGVIKDLQSIVKDRHICRYSGNFHVKCILIWFYKNNNCPMCRDRFRTDEVIYENTYFPRYIEKTLNVVSFLYKYLIWLPYVLGMYYICRNIYYIIIYKL